MEKSIQCVSTKFQPHVQTLTDALIDYRKQGETRARFQQKQ